MDRFPPIFLSFLRFMIVGLAVLPWLRVRRGEMRWLLVAAICGGGLQFALIVIAAFIGSIGLVAIKRVHDLKPLELQAWLALAQYCIRRFWRACLRTRLTSRSCTVIPSPASRRSRCWAPCSAWHSQFSCSATCWTGG